MMLVFCVYLLALPVVACAGTDNCMDAATELIVKQTADQADHEENEDGCGNFCTCSCCLHIVSVNFQSPLISIVKPIIKSKKLLFYHNISLPSNYFGNIWQPPKMC